jgi:hypothetical protein
VQALDADVAVLIGWGRGDAKTLRKRQTAKVIACNVQIRASLIISFMPSHDPRIAEIPQIKRARKREKESLIKEA